MKDLILLKLGGSIITEKNLPFTLNRKSVNRLAMEIAEAHNKRKFKLVLIHGAGSFGHYIVSKTGIDKGIKDEKQLLSFAATQRWQNYLNCMITESLQNQELPAIPCQPSSFAVMDSGKLVWMPLQTIKKFLEINLIPVLYGVPAVDRKQKCSILSGDEIISWFAKKLKPERIIHATDVDGVFDSDPNLNPKAKLIKEINSKNWDLIKKCLSGSTTTDVTGGMLRKISELVKLGRLGIESEIINAGKQNILKRTLLGEKELGTIIKI